MSNPNLYGNGNRGGQNPINQPGLRRLHQQHGPGQIITPDSKQIVTDSDFGNVQIQDTDEAVYYHTKRPAIVFKEIYGLTTPGTPQRLYLLTRPIGIEIINQSVDNLYVTFNGVIPNTAAAAQSALYLSFEDNGQLLVSGGMSYTYNGIYLKRYNVAVPNRGPQPALVPIFLDSAIAVNYLLLLKFHSEPKIVLGA